LKDSGKKSDRGKSKLQTVRYPELVKAFTARYERLLHEADVTQLELAEQLGAFRYETLSRLRRGIATGLPIDLMIRLLMWVDEHGFSLRWFISGAGNPREIDVGERGPSAVTSLANITIMHTLLTIAVRAKVKYDDLLDAEMAAALGPGNMVITMPLRQAINLLGLRVDGKYSDDVGEIIRGAQEELAKAASWPIHVQKELAADVRAAVTSWEARLGSTEPVHKVMSEETKAAIERLVEDVERKRRGGGSSKAG
jgi:hypothetical protein